jgi:hypothetical protein
MDTLREGLSDTVNELNKLLLVTQDPVEETRIRQLRRIYFNLWEEVILKEIDRHTAAYKEALGCLDQAHQTIETAKRDIAQVAAAIELAATAAKAVDRIVNLGFGLLA